MSTHNIYFYKSEKTNNKNTKTSHKHHLVSPLLIIFVKCIPSISGVIFYHKFSLSAQRNNKEEYGTLKGKNLLILKEIYMLIIEY